MLNPPFAISFRLLPGALLLLSALPVHADSPVEFQRDIRPILSNHCYQCHGPDSTTREAELRLDLASAAIVELGGKAIRRDQPEASALLQRIESSDPEQRMPPADAHKPLSDSQRAMLARWVREGAVWDEHWAYKTPHRPQVPVTSLPCANPIDAFIRARLEQEGITPSPPADRYILAKRLSLDLIGMPPNPTEVDALVADPHTTAIADYVDRLLSSPHFGERLAVYWFDLVRFANSIGIHSDNEWAVTPYRNWVINAFNSNMPFDQFTREQLAGDLVPNATTEQKVAAVYNRLNLITAEGGSQAKEFLVKYTADRVRNATSVWLATTMGCAECHNHKFDPISSREFYQFGAFFADIQQRGVYSGEDHGPYMEVPTAEQDALRKELQAQIDSVTQVYASDTEAVIAARRQWEADTIRLLSQEPQWSPWQAVGPFFAGSVDDAHRKPWGPEETLSDFQAGSDQATRFTNILAKQYGPDALKWTEHAEWKDGEITSLKGDNSATYLLRSVTVPEPRRLVLKLGSDDGIRVWLNGEQVFDLLASRGVKPDEDTVELNLPAGQSHILLKISNGGGLYGFYFRALGADVPSDVADIVRKGAEQRTPPENDRLAAHFRTITPLLAESRATLQGLQKRLEELNRSVMRTIATIPMEAMPIRILARGNWMDETGEVVNPGLPTALSGAIRPGEMTRRLNRLDLAEWIVDRQNPLTARVFVNRLWMLFFGAGISKSVNDFGAQGETPSHPELLDWLAVEFMESGWDVKHIVRLIVTSDTYLQSSAPRPELAEKDPFNRWLAHQSGIRLDAEFVRDLALTASGRINEAVGGGVVSKPYQPAGYYRHMNFPPREYANDLNENQFRRGVYMHRQRMFLHPALVALDAPPREECVAERRRSNTPLAALVLLNDPCYVEAARVLGMEVMRQGGADRRGALNWAVRRVLARPAQDAELEVLEKLWTTQHAMFAADNAAAEQLLHIGITPVPADLDAAQLAAWTMVSRALLNMHETITRY